jgi:hypothetical protein
MMAKRDSVLVGDELPLGSFCNRAEYFEVCICTSSFDMYKRKTPVSHSGSLCVPCLLNWYLRWRCSMFCDIETEFQIREIAGFI